MVPGSVLVRLSRVPADPQVHLKVISSPVILNVEKTMISAATVASMKLWLNFLLTMICLAVVGACIGYCVGSAIDSLRQRWNHVQ